LFIDGQKVGTESNVPSNSTFKDDLPPTFDIGLKKGGRSLIGHLRDLMIIRRPLTGEELTNMEGEKLLTFQMSNLNTKLKIENICKGWSRQREHRRCYNISAGQHQPSSGFVS